MNCGTLIEVKEKGKHEKVFHLTILNAVKNKTQNLHRKNEKLFYLSAFLLEFWGVGKIKTTTVNIFLIFKMITRLPQ